jgi:hypothetical protein
MRLRIVLAGILGGIVLFNWGFVAHMVLPLGMMGIRNIPDEGPIAMAIKGNVPEPGMYMLPGWDFSKSQTPPDMKEHELKLKKGPSGVMVLNPGPGEVDLTPHLIKEVITNIVSALLAAMLLAQLRTNFAGRVLFVMCLGLFAWIVVCVPNWNWYSYPMEFTLARAVEYVVGWTLVGLVLGAIVKHPQPVDQAPKVA